MKTCPKCEREYSDESLNFCLEDGEWLVEGALSREPATAILSRSDSSTEKPTVALEDGQTSGDQIRRSYSKQAYFAAFGVLLIVSVAAYVGYRNYTFPGGYGQIESIAVMPFVNESGTADVEYLSDGMTEILIRSLSQLPNLNVKARSSVFRYKGKETDLRQVARGLSVQAILTGRVVQRSNNLTLYIELVDAGTENVLWKADYNRSMTDLVSLQNEIAQDISQKLRIKLSAADEQRLTKKNYSANAEAYQLYLQGRYFWNKQTNKDVEKSVEYFQKAIEIDPNYALAYTGPKEKDRAHLK